MPCLSQKLIDICYPDTGGTVVAGGDDGLAIRVVGRSVDFVGVTCELAYLFARGGIPDAGSTVSTGGDDVLVQSFYVPWLLPAKPWKRTSLEESRRNYSACGAASLLLQA